MDRWGPSEDCPICGQAKSANDFEVCPVCERTMCLDCLYNHWCHDVYNNDKDDEE